MNKLAAQVGVFIAGVENESGVQATGDFVQELPQWLRPPVELKPGAKNYTLQGRSRVSRVTVRISLRSFYAKPVPDDMLAELGLSRDSFGGACLSMRRHGLEKSVGWVSKLLND